MHTSRLSELPLGKSGVLQRLDLPAAYRKRLYDLGFIPGTSITCCHIGPSGTPIAFSLKHSMVALRTKDCGSIIIQRHE